MQLRGIEVDKSDPDKKSVNATFKKKNHQRLRRVASSLNLTNSEVLCGLIETLPDDVIKELVEWKVEEKKTEKRKQSGQGEANEGSARPMNQADVKKLLSSLKQDNKK